MRFRLSLFVALALVVFTASPSAGSDAFAEVVANLVSFDPATQTASYRVDTLYQYAGDELTRHDEGLRVTCNILGPRPWSTALQNGETMLSFPLVRSNGLWLEVPAEGWRVGCRCKGLTNAKEVAMFGMFVTPQGLSSKIKGKRGSTVVRIVSLGGGGKDRLPQTIRVRLGWTRGLLDAAT